MFFSNCKTHQFRERRMLFTLLMLSKALNYFECSTANRANFDCMLNKPTHVLSISFRRTIRSEKIDVLNKITRIYQSWKKLSLFTLIIFNNPRNFIVIRNGSHVPKTVTNRSICVCMIRSAAFIMPVGCFFPVCFRIVCKVMKIYNFTCCC